MESWVQLPPARGYASPRTMKVRVLVQSMVSTSDGRDWTYRAPLSECLFFFDILCSADPRGPCPRELMWNQPPYSSTSPSSAVSPL